MLTARDAAYEYGAGTGYATPALDGVDLSLAPGTVLLVVGETGSGKTTLLRVLSGLLEPTRGEVSVDGKAPEPASVDAERRVGLLFQRAEAQLFAESVLADVAFGPRNLGESTERANEAARAALEDVGLDPGAFAERSPFSLSGGEARRVALAGVLAMKPRYLLLDEPTAGLDAHGRAAVRTAIIAARRTCGVAVVTHDPAELLDMAEHILVLSRGRSVFGGTVDDFLEAAASGSEVLPVPELVAVQVAARRAGMALPRLFAHPGEAARAIAEACRP